MMRDSDTEIIRLREYEPTRLPRRTFTRRQGARLWREYDQNGRKLRVAFPTYATGDQWELTPQGWVGAIPVTPDRWLWLRPRTPLTTLFRMVAYAYDLPIQWLPGVHEVTSLLDFYQKLALLLAQKTQKRAGQGLHRAYVSRQEASPVVRGRLQFTPPPRPERVRLPCRYQAFQADIPDNQILAYTLGTIARSGLCDETAQPAVRQTARLLNGITTPRSFTPEECTARSYTRLNADYRPLHALCRFFLTHTGPAHRLGQYEMMPFLLEMPTLYERFVARWLGAHLPPPWRVREKEKKVFAASYPLKFEMDLVLYQGSERRAVLDTKYKLPTSAATADVHQVVAYAEALRCPEALLVYPRPLPQPLDAQIGAVRVRSMAFTLDDDLETAGQVFLRRLMAIGTRPFT